LKHQSSHSLHKQLEKTSEKENLLTAKKKKGNYALKEKKFLSLTKVSLVDWITLK